MRFMGNLQYFLESIVVISRALCSVLFICRVDHTAMPPTKRICRMVNILFLEG